MEKNVFFGKFICLLRIILCYCDHSKFLGQIRRKRMLRKREQRVKMFLKHLRNQRRFACFLVMNILIWHQRTSRERSIWKINRESDAYYDSGSWSNDEYRCHLRLDKNLFEYLLNLIQDQRAKDTNMRIAIPLQKRLMMSLWYLCSVTDFRSLSVTFGCGKSTAWKIIHKIVPGIKSLAKKIIRFPVTDESVLEMVQGFQDRGFPQTIGAIDGMHLPILAPSNNSSDFYNRKGFYSIVMQSVADHKFRFVDVYIGWPGKAHDARIFKHSSIFKKLSTSFMPHLSSIINNVCIPLHMIGDAAYPLSPSLMTPFRGKLSQTQENFNYKHSSARMVIENAFGRLKSRWRVLSKRFDGRLTFFTEVVLACCVLHNLCELGTVQGIEEWVKEAEKEDGIILHDNRPSPVIHNAKEIRNVIASGL